jgi:16S rRNA U1498 N3-methylase RsmE
VYWSGVAFFIEAQYQLKLQQARYKSIAELVKTYQACCKESEQQSGRQFLTELDKLSKTAVFNNLYLKYKNRTDLPKYKQKQFKE